MKHLKMEERSAIENGLNQRKSFNEIAKEIGKSPSTVSKEVRKHLMQETTGSSGSGHNSCKYRMGCTEKGVCKICYQQHKTNCWSCGKCNGVCPKYEEEICSKLSSPPYCCNGCIKRRRCTLTKSFYKAHKADEAYRNNLSECRTGFNMIPEEIRSVSNFLTPLLKNGQSLHHILVTNRDVLPYSEKTLYNLQEAGLLEATAIDMPRKARLKPRKKSKNQEVKIERDCYKRRSYEDFLHFTHDNPDVPVVQIDTVEGKKGGKVLLTMHFENSGLLLAFLRDSNTARSVNEIINNLYETLSHEKYCSMFPIILTDRGTEFSNPSALEKDDEGNLRSLVFYCDAGRPDQKGNIEVCHEMIRRFVPKGVPFDNLTQEDISLMCSHINSVRRGKLNDRSANQVFSFLYGEATLNSLNLKDIPAKEVVLSPKLFKK